MRTPLRRASGDPPAQETLAHEINPTVYSPKEFRQKLAKKHPFLSNILTGPTLVLIGDEAPLNQSS